MINVTVLTGRLTRDPELKYTNSGVAVATFNLAVNRPFKNQDGDREADFINCVIWRKAAENFANFTRKGSLVGVTGRIQTRNYENQQGQRVYVTEVIVENFSLLEPRNDGNQRQQNNGGYRNNSNRQNGQQQNQRSNNQQDPFRNDGDQIDISDDDLPF